jgi:hypothetical protein
LALVILFGSLLGFPAGPPTSAFGPPPDGGGRTGPSASFAVIGDSGTGKPEQWAVAHEMQRIHDQDPFDFVVMLGDNIYGGASSPDAFTKRFEEPYADLINDGIEFYAVLGNHGSGKREINYKLFNMDGHRYYSFTRGDGLVQFFALDSSGMDREQLDWLEKELSASTATWKIVAMHHPMYSCGKKHGPSMKLRSLLEPMFLRHKVNVVLSGHEHFYARLKPQNGIYYFISGAGGSIRRGNIIKSDPELAHGYDEASNFMVMDVTRETLHFEAISEKGEVVDSGVIRAAR